MIQQTSHNFYWFILVEQDLDQALLDDLHDLLDAIPFAYLILSSTNDVELPEDSYFVDVQEILELYEEEKILIVTGDLDRIQQLDLRRARSSKDASYILRMDTRLDFDEGLDKTAIEQMQMIAPDHTEVRTPNLSKSWWFLCFGSYFEWRNTCKTWRNSSEELSVGMVAILEVHEHVCVPAGLTRVGSLVRSKVEEFPMKANIPISETEKPIRPKNCPSRHQGPYRHCSVRVLKSTPMALRSLTVASRSFDHHSEAESNEAECYYDREDTNHWQELTNSTGILRSSAWKVSQFLNEDWV
jgi:hypothetical protein